MSLSFREQAAIALWSGHTTSTERAVEIAGKLATEACEAWGHHWPVHRPPEGPGMCLRCGVPEAPTKEKPAFEPGDTIADILKDAPEPMTFEQISDRVDVIMQAHPTWRAVLAFVGGARAFTRASLDQAIASGRVKTQLDRIPGLYSLVDLSKAVPEADVANEIETQTAEKIAKYLRALRKTPFGSKAEAFLDVLADMIERGDWR